MKSKFAKILAAIALFITESACMGCVIFLSEEPVALNCMND